MDYQLNYTSEWRKMVHLLKENDFSTDIFIAKFVVVIFIFSNNIVSMFVIIHHKRVIPFSNIQKM